MTKPQRYGTSGAPREDGVFVHFSEYEKVVAERDALRGEAAVMADDVRALREDKARLDSGCILTAERDEFGEEYFCERRGNNLRQMIDNAMALAHRVEIKAEVKP